DPRSPLAAAQLTGLFIEEGRTDLRVQWLEKHAAVQQGDRAAETYWEAAQLTADAGGRFPRARRLYLAAAEASSAPLPILRELFGVALRHAPDQTPELASSLLAQPLDEDERSAILHEQYTHLR